MYADQFEIYHGNSNPDLARKISRYLGSEPGKAEVFQFANENIFVRVMENVREQDVFLVQPTCRPVNQSIMELLIMIDAFKRASAGRITAVIRPALARLKASIMISSSMTESFTGREVGCTRKTSCSRTFSITRTKMLSFANLKTCTSPMWVRR